MNYKDVTGKKKVLVTFLIKFLEDQISNSNIPKSNI